MEARPARRDDARACASISSAPAAPPPSPPTARVALRAEVTDKIRSIPRASVSPTSRPRSSCPCPASPWAASGAGCRPRCSRARGSRWICPTPPPRASTLFDNVFLNMSDTSSAVSAPGRAPTIARAAQPGIGLRARGLRSPPADARGWAASSRTPSRDRPGAMDKRTFPSAFDRTHVLNARRGLRPRPGLARRGALHLLHRRLRRSPGRTWRWRRATERAARERNPAFYRLDLRVEKRWTLQKARWISVRGRDDQHHAAQGDRQRRRDRAGRHPQPRRRRRVLMNARVLDLHRSGRRGGAAPGGVSARRHPASARGDSLHGRAERRGHRGGDDGRRVAYRL